MEGTKAIAEKWGADAVRTRCGIATERICRRTLGNYAAKATYSKTTTNTQLYTHVALSELNKYVVANEDGIARFKVKFTFSEWTSFKLFETTQSSTEIMFVGLDVGWSGIWFTFELDTINKTLKVTQPDGTDKVYSITSTNVSDYAFMRTGEKTFDIEVVNL